MITGTYDSAPEQYRCYYCHQYFEGIDALETHLYAKHYHHTPEDARASHREMQLLRLRNQKSNGSA